MCDSEAGSLGSQAAPGQHFLDGSVGPKRWQRKQSSPDPHPSWGRDECVSDAPERVAISDKPSLYLPHNSAALLDAHPREATTYTYIFMVALFTITGDWTEPRHCTW